MLWHLTPSAEPKQKRETTSLSTSQHCCWTRKPRRECCGHKTTREGLYPHPHPTCSRGCSRKPSLPHLVQMRVWTRSVPLKRKGPSGTGNASEQLHERSEHAITAWHLYEPAVLKTQAYFLTRPYLNLPGALCTRKSVQANRLTFWGHANVQDPQRSVLHLPKSLIT